MQFIVNPKEKEITILGGEWTTEELIEFLENYPDHKIQVEEFDEVVEDNNTQYIWTTSDGFNTWSTGQELHTLSSIPRPMEKYMLNLLDECNS